LPPKYKNPIMVPTEERRTDLAEFFNELLQHREARRSVLLKQFFANPSLFESKGASAVVPTLTKTDEGRRLLQEHKRFPDFFDWVRERILSHPATLQALRGEPVTSDGGAGDGTVDLHVESEDELPVLD